MSLPQPITRLSSSRFGQQKWLVPAVSPDGARTLQILASNSSGNEDMRALKTAVRLGRELLNLQSTRACMCWIATSPATDQAKAAW
ncbi:uncharacterized protein MAM_06534 [Metarhizium album ARSEF 1941]|uniref:Uncharacterized protein n=1 Tax=Metarhizium album (strain ARSEF 1941) TaxID=1081103 RepID=A0A0B2WNW5_METAS|nr:uncharacterized protein MAM_06534 [Metarhizium album ARSEF 1941]KHN95693.1 hypothetical protein MAM_06534 [Metarhizium album ARSEF 1941]